MRLLDLRINFFFIHCGLFVLILVVFVLFLLHFETACQKIAVSNLTQADQRFTWSKTWCDTQQLWKAVITGDTVTRLSIPIRGRGQSPEEGQK